MRTPTDQLLESLKNFGVRLDGWSAGAGRFRTLHIGTGADVDTLNKLRDDLIRRFGSGCAGCVKVTQVSVALHPDYHKFYLEFSSFWWEEPTA